MMHHSNYSAIFTALLVCLRSCIAQEQPHAQLKQGSVLGLDLDDEVAAFLGVPYAQPPIESLRFKPPYPLPSSDSVFNATKHGDACMQHRYNNILKANEEPPSQSEDCLNVDIYVPRYRNVSTALPILVWFYGGSMSQGANSLASKSLYYDFREGNAKESRC